MMSIFPRCGLSCFLTCGPHHCLCSRCPHSLPFGWPVFCARATVIAVTPPALYNRHSLSLPYPPEVMLVDNRLILEHRKVPKIHPSNIYEPKEPKLSHKGHTST